MFVFADYFLFFRQSSLTKKMRKRKRMNNKRMERREGMRWPEMRH
jgi:hypothetical protein